MSNRESIRRFELVRNNDPTGVSGTGVVGYGVEFPSGAVVLEWHAGGSDIQAENGMTLKPAPDGIADLIEVHGHGGKTRIRWLDYPDADTDANTDGSADACCDVNALLTAIYERSKRLLGKPGGRHDADSDAGSD